MRLLVKPSPAASSSPGTRLAARGKSAKVEAIGRAKARQAPSLYAVELREAPDNPWDAVHDLVARGGEANSPLQGSVEWVEPDLEHTIFLPPAPAKNKGAALAAAAAIETGKFGWHLGDAYSQLRAARAAVEFPDDDGSRVRVGHIDTGFDPAHATRPRHVNTALSRNFVEGGKDARDPGKAFPQDPGHGAGTLSILAGGRHKNGDFDEDLGGCPEAEIVPMRVANSVVLLRTSALVEALRYAIDSHCDVVSLSMGGLASQLWADAVNDIYRAGIVMVAAAGNNVAGIVTSELVYPARFGRVIAACGVMFKGEPYRKLSRFTLQGNSGPKEAMGAALAAYTPGIPWAKWGKQGAGEVDPMGVGTSSATPQIAAAAALYIQKHRAALDALPQPWMRGECVRRALFQSASRTHPHWRDFFGNGVLRALDALAIAPSAAVAMTPPDNAANAFLKALPGPFGLTLAAAAADPHARYFALELAQRGVLVDPKRKREMLEAVAEDKHASQALRQHLKKQLRREPERRDEPAAKPGESFRPAMVPHPPARRLRVFAFDPSFSTRLDRAVSNEVELRIRWEKGLWKGPCGEYVDVIDVDPPSQCFYEPVDLNDTNIVAQAGLSPSEGNPQFHQQMVYGVAMKTIEHFERALGRPVFWATPQGAPLDQFNSRLRIYPHALREANAYYSPERAALLFGYFPADLRAAGGMVFTCLSHDVIAHETTHAILDGMHRRFQLPTNPDMLAFHEAFADIVALFSRFSLPGVLELEIAQTRGDLEQESTLGQLAQQFGAALGERGALRSAIGTRNEQGKWVRTRPDPARYQTVMEPHHRGSILVSAVFDVFLAIYKRRTLDLLRIASEGSGVLRAGAIHPDLVARLAGEAATTASQILNICIRALDYCPPVDLTFGEYLRALITADFDLVPDDQTGYRVAFVESFRNWGIYPNDVRSLSVESLLWSTTSEGNTRLAIRPEGLSLLKMLREFHQSWSTINPQQASADPGTGAYRQKIFDLSRDQAGRLHEELLTLFRSDPVLACEVGLDPTIVVARGRGRERRMMFEVHTVRIAERQRPDGSMVRHVIVTVTQKRDVRLDNGGAFTFRGGSTIIVDLDAPANQLRYVIRKNITSKSREERTRKLLGKRGSAMGLRAVYFGGGGDGEPGEPFALLHRHASDGEGY
ncbi:MAG: S8 family serine peptidase [Bryobacterales bacterium]|nr:S8 family serine peptidase [Bryobacterales bacterium]